MVNSTGEMQWWDGDTIRAPFVINADGRMLLRKKVTKEIEEVAPVTYEGIEYSVPYWMVEAHPHWTPSPETE